MFLTCIVLYDALTLKDSKMFLLECFRQQLLFTHSAAAVLVCCLLFCFTIFNPNYTIQTHRNALINYASLLNFNVCNEICRRGVLENVSRCCSEKSMLMQMKYDCIYLESYGKIFATFQMIDQHFLMIKHILSNAGV